MEPTPATSGSSGRVTVVAHLWTPRLDPPLNDGEIVVFYWWLSLGVVAGIGAALGWLLRGRR